ncbi:MAG: lipoyl synthase [Clostridia bacterium]|nr:lipoyl synthase [Clostridia bacterium]
MTSPTNPTQKSRKPDWFKVQANAGEANEAVIRLIRSLNLHTVCEEANCPNAGECFSNKTATFMLLGSQCTRNCTFCAVGKGFPEMPDPDEPARLAEAIAQLKLRHVVLTTVTRDDLPDGGASHFVAVIAAIRDKIPENTPAIEVLISDLQGNWDALQQIIDARPQVINHNVETVPRLYPEVRPEADFARSVDLLRRVNVQNPDILTKSGIMVGLGETPSEVLEVLKSLREAGCKLLTIGQYLAPSSKHHPVVEYIHPDQFLAYKKAGEAMGFAHVASGPLVRSSYHAGEALDHTRH